LNGHRRLVCVHRKGATRALGAGNPALPEALRPLGQPVIIPGDMGRCSFVLIGLEAAMRETFGSSCHGAGRLMSRSAAKKQARGRDLPAELRALGVTIRAHSRGGIAEEMPAAYKDVAEVVEVMEAAGVTKRVARLRPLAVIKG
jgi:tRNA-splicing ligase RtcB (3'-phosphate/5'-hydroxy nucleic acid ligase)